jgi:hypothetical protein
MSNTMSMYVKFMNYKIQADKNGLTKVLYMLFY